MLFFIKVQRLHNLAAKKFKYISCYSLSGGFYPLDCMAGQFKYISCYSLSNHAKQLDWYPGAFKYISCYSLSNLVHTQHQYFVDLNTSHVILYQNNRKSEEYAEKFKYISCYSLSVNSYYIFYPNLI